MEHMMSTIRQAQGSSRRGATLRLDCQWLPAWRARLGAMLKAPCFRLGLLTAAMLFITGAAWFTPLGSWPGFPRGPALAVAVSGHYAYVAAEEGGLLVFDVSDPGQPVRVGNYHVPGWTRSIQIEGNLGIVGANGPLTGGCSGSQFGRLELLDLTNPAQPRRLGSYHVASSLLGIQVVGQRAYVLQSGPGSAGLFEVVDLSNPAQPRGLGAWRADEGTIHSFHVVSNYAYVAFDNYIKILDVSRPTRVVEVGAAHTPGNISSMDVAGNLACLIWQSEDGSTNGLSLFDVSDPVRPLIRGGITLSNQVLAVQASGGRAHLAGGAAGLLVVDVSEPSQPVVLTNFYTGAFTAALAVAGNQAYLADYDGGLQVVDLGGPDAPKRLSVQDTGLTAALLQVAGTNAYLVSLDTYFLADDASNRLEVLDVSSPGQPQQAGSYALADGVSAFQVVDNHAYVVQGERVDILDVSTPSQPVLCGSYEAQSQVQSLCVRSNYAYVAATAVEIVNVSDPTHPSRVGTWNGYAGWGGIVVNGSYLYGPNTVWPNTPDQRTDLVVVNASNPASLVEVGRLEYFYGGLVSSTDHLVFATSGSSLTIIDVSNPFQPIQVGYYTCDDTIADVEVVGQYVYLATTWAGVEVLDLSQPSEPVSVARYATPGRAVGVRVRGSCVYLADAAWGLVVLRLPEPAVAIAEQPQSQGLALPGEALSVRAYGTGPLNYQWYQGQSGDTSCPVAGGNSSSFAPPLSGAPTAYWVRVSSAAGSVDSQAAWITAQPSFVLEEIGAWPGSPRGDITALDIVEDHAYLAVRNLGLAVVDLRDRAKPVLAGTWASTDEVDYPILDVRVTNSFAYVLRSDRLEIVDVSNPAKPVGVGANVGNLDSAQFVRLAGAYVVVGQYDQLSLINVSVPARPALVGTYATGSGLTALEVAGQYAYAAVTGSGGLLIVNISNPARPVQAGLYPYQPQIQAGTYPDYIDTTVLQVVGQRAYLSTTNEMGSLEMVDVSNPAQPRGLGDYGASVAGLVVSGDLVYLCRQNPCLQSHLEVVDFKDPTQPVSLGSCDLPGGTLRGLEAAGSYAYVADAFTGLGVMDISQPDQPTMVGAFNPYGEAVEVQVVGDLAFLADGPGGLRIVDVSNPIAPVLVGQLTMVNGAEAVQVQDQQAFVANWGSLTVVAVTNPAAPVQLGVWSVEADLKDAATGFG